MVYIKKTYNEYSTPSKKMFNNTKRKKCLYKLPKRVSIE